MHLFGNYGCKVSDRRQLAVNRGKSQGGRGVVGGETYIYWAVMGVKLASGDNWLSIEIGTRAGGGVWMGRHTSIGQLWV